MVAGIIGVDTGTTVTIGVGESTSVFLLGGLYYFKVDGTGIMGGVLVFRTRKSMTIVAKTHAFAYDVLTVTEESDGQYVTLTNTGSVEIKVIYRLL